MTSIYSLPNEILISICSQLGTPDLLHCAQVSQHFRELINNDALVQYRAELNIHGMADVLQEDLPVATKLRTLKLYEERFHLAAFHRTTLANPGSDAGRTFTSFVSSDGSILHFTRTQGSGSRCVVDKLPSTARSLRASRWTAPLPGIANMDVLAMDVSQNLTVAIEHSHDKEVLIHFVTAAAGQPHPLAAKPVLDATGTSASVDGPDAYYHIQSVHISGTNVAWVIPGFNSEGLDTLQCWNWQTGLLVWERQCDGLAGHTFLDSRFVLTVARRGQEPILCIHDLESRADGGGDTTTEPVCRLELPRARAGVVEVVHVQARAAADSRNADVPFVRDPMSTAVVLQLAVGRDTEGASSDIIVMIPHRTMYDQIKEAIPSSCGNQADRVVEWDKWGLSGAVVLDLPPKALAAENGGWFVPPDVWPQSFGSRLGLLLCDSPDITSGFVVTVDIHPWASKCARRYSGHQGHSAHWGGLTGSSVDGPSPDVVRRLASMPKNVASVATNLSHALQVGSRIVFPPGQRPSQIITVHDGFAVAFEGDVSEVGLQVFTV